MATGTQGIWGAGILAGQSCIVTGGGSGIGRAIALALAGCGARVTVLGRRLEALEQTVALAAGLAGPIEACACDVRNTDAMAERITRIGTAHGIDLLVNNAGGQFYALASEISRRGWDSVIDLNLSAIFSVTLAAHPFLRRNGGAVVNISISGVDRGMSGAAHALAARAGVLAMTRSLALEWAADRIRLNCIGPGLVLTEGLANAAPDVIADFLAAVPLGRPTDPDEVAGLVVFLASRAGHMMTGQLLQIDGGIHIGPGIHPVRPAT